MKTLKFLIAFAALISLSFASVAANAPIRMVTLNNIFSLDLSSSCALTVTPSNQNVPYTPAGSTTFTVTTDCSWTAVSNQTWCTVTPSGTGNGTITANYNENTSGSTRIASITVTVTGLSKVVTVKQVAVSCSLTVTPSNQNVPNTPAGSKSFSVTSNCPWTAASNQSWCTVTPSGTGNGTIIAQYSINTTLSIRIADITVTVPGLSPVVVTVTQAAAPISLTVTPQNQDVPYSPASYTYFSVASNSSWTAASNQSWCTVTPSGTGNGTIIANYTINSATSTRTASITVTVIGLTPKVVTVTQTPMIPAPISTIASITACPGTTINIPITVVNFSGISTITLAINYEPAVLTFNSCTSPTLLDGILNFTSSQIPNSNLYLISISWMQTSTSYSLPNGATLFNLSFNYINGSSTINFDDLLGVCEYTNSLVVLNDTPTASYYFNGSVSSAVVSAIGVLTGPQSVTRGATDLVYTTTSIPNATSYSWTLPLGFNITSGEGTNSLSIKTTDEAVTGAVTVKGTSTCGSGPVASLAVEVVKNLSISVFLESLFNGSGLNKAQNETGYQFGGKIADQIIVELHSPTHYDSIICSVANVNLDTLGLAFTTIPVIYNKSYYLTIKHRNSIETVSANPVPFSPSIITYSFVSLTQAYGGNLKLLAPDVYGIFAGDVDNNGFVNSEDIESASTLFQTGYSDNDINGDGIVDGLDLIMADNNAAMFVSVKKP